MGAMDETREHSRIGTTTATNVGESRRIGRRRSDRVVGASASLQRAIDQATAAARSDLLVVIRGPSGVGRSHLARSIHAWGERNGSAFVERACAALPEALQLREIFGCGPGVHALVPGEYDGACAQAAGGTLLLTDAEQLRSDVREAVIEALAQGTYHREGESARMPLRARIIATTASEESPFGDLPHHAIRLAPLVERPEDVLPLAAHFLATFAEEAGVSGVGFTEDARSGLLNESWAGNVRELRERVRLAIRLAEGGAITAESLMLSHDGTDVPSFKEAKRAFETRYVQGLLRRCGGNISRAARLAKKDRKDFYDVIRRTGVDPSAFRG